MGHGNIWRPPRQRGGRLVPPMRAWLTPPHGRHHKAPPPPCALTTRHAGTNQRAIHHKGGVASSDRREGGFAKETKAGTPGPRRRGRGDRARRRANAFGRTRRRERKGKLRHQASTQGGSEAARAGFAGELRPPPGGATPTTSGVFRHRARASKRCPIPGHLCAEAQSFPAVLAAL